MHSILRNVTRGQIQREPFPHIVVKNALDPDLYRQLVDELPPLEVLTKGRRAGNNRRFAYWAVNLLNEPRVTPQWKAFINLHTSNLFYRQIIDLLGDEILRVNPELKLRYGNLTGLKTGLRKVDTYQGADVLLEARIDVNTPVRRKPTSVRGAHLDNPNKLFTGLLYLRRPDDDWQGGNLNFYRYRTRPTRGSFRGFDVAPKCVEVVKSIENEGNTLVLFVNSFDSVHGVSTRSVTERSRHLAFFTAETHNSPCCNLQPYQVR